MEACKIHKFHFSNKRFTYSKNFGVHKLIFHQKYMYIQQHDKKKNNKKNLLWPILGRRNNNNNQNTFKLY